ncbi:MAG: hypothetical protein U9R25_10960 [Chloroflexota bacterium]|nr:hypothetical protein [Chloroflexota bacterium]
MSRDNDSILRASEIGEYLYCSRAWWLRRVRNVPSDNVASLQAGQDEHDRHARSVAGYHRQRRLAFLLGTLALLTAVVALLMALGGAS